MEGMTDNVFVAKTSAKDEFARTELLIGKDRMQKLWEASVMVLGVGGVGSHCIEALARSKVGRLILVDSDRVSLTNINRQSIALHSTIGRYKTEVMKEKIADISPQTEVITHELFVLPENIEDIFDVRPDYIIDAIDTVTAKLALIEKAVEYGIPIISSMGTGNKLHAELFEITDISRTSVCPLCKVMRKELRARGIEHLKVLYSKEKPIAASESVMKEEEGLIDGIDDRKKKGHKRPVPGSIAFVPPVAGLLIAGEVIRELTGLSLPKMRDPLMPVKFAASKGRRERGKRYGF